MYLYDDYISAKTIFRSCHRSNQNILICVPLHARKSLFPIIPSPVSKLHFLPLLKSRNFPSLPYPPFQYSSTSPGCNPSLLPTTALTFLDLTQSFPSLYLTHNPPLLLQSEFFVRPMSCLCFNCFSVRVLSPLYLWQITFISGDVYMHARNPLSSHSTSCQETLFSVLV